jgi:mono/diheme cytochrome c family protein
VLFSALTAFAGALALSRLPEFAHPLFASQRFRRVTTDGFFISIEASDPEFDVQATQRLLESVGATAVEVCREPAEGRTVPRPIFWGLAVAGALAVLPPLVIASYRSMPKRQPRIHPVLDMDFQPKYQAQAASPLFLDGRAMRPPVAGTVARGRLEDDDALYRGRVPGREEEWVTSFPVPVTDELVRRGRERFDVYCATCHGLTGEGDGPTSLRAQERGEEKWVPPLSLHVDSVREQPVGQLYHSITNGVRTMPAYGSQIPVADRWAIVLYVRALQRSRNAGLEDVPPELRDRIR